jgi:hypothetical protein
LTELQEEIESAFRKLPFAPPVEGQIPYTLCMPGIVRQLSLMKPLSRRFASGGDTTRKLVALKGLAKKLCEDTFAMAHVPLTHRILIAQLAHEEIPDFPTMAGRGAPQKELAARVAQEVALHYFGLTGKRPTRITPLDDRKGHGDFAELLGTIFRLLGIKASAENQTKSAINFLNKKYPRH